MRCETSNPSCNMVLERLLLEDAPSNPVCSHSASGDPDWCIAVFSLCNSWCTGLDLLRSNL